MTTGGSEHDPLAQLADADRGHLLEALYAVTGGGDADPDTTRGRLLARLEALRVPGKGRFDIDFSVADADADADEPPIPPPGRLSLVTPGLAPDQPGWLALRLLCDVVDEDEDRMLTSRSRRDKAIKRDLEEGVSEAELERVTGLSRTTINKIGRGGRDTHRGRGRTVRTPRVVL